MKKKGYDNNYKEKRKHAIWFGVKEIINEDWLGGFDTEIVDSHGNVIDEEFFDAENKYNVWNI